MQDACKWVVFNKMFFSQLAPLTAAQKNFIENKLLNLSKDSLNTVFYPNFLYTENRRVPGRTVYDSLVRMGVEAGVPPNTGSSGTGANSSGIPATPISGLRAIRAIFPNIIGTAVESPNPTMIFNQAARSLNGCAREIRRNNVPNDGNLVNWEYLANETYAINNGSVLTKYKKVGYFKESDIAIEGGALYDSGPGYDEAVLGGSSTLRDRLLRNVSIDVCLDLNLGIRTNRMHHWSNPGGVPLGDSRLHLVQSNSIDPFCNSTNMRNLPLDRGILHVDAYPYPSWDMPAVSRPQDIYLPYVTVSGSITGSGSSTERRIIQDDFLNYKEEFHLRIVESDYRFSFLII